MTIEQFTDYLESAGADIRTDYSGRAMFGDTCIGFDVENTSDALQIIAEATLHADKAYNGEDFVKTLRGVRTDSMGRGMIYYFPNMQTAQEAK